MARFLLVFATAIAMAASAAAQAGTWQIDPNHTAAQFSVRHLGVSTVRGAFTKVAGSAQHDAADPSKDTLEATIDANSVDTRVQMRDNDLRSPRFFDVQKYPTITFHSKQATVVGPGKLQITGDLTIHGVTRKVTFAVEGPTPPAKDPWGNTRLAVSATTKINRKDFGLTWNAALETGGILVGEDVTITLEVQFVKA